MTPPKRLTQEQVEHYREFGYVSGIPIFGPDEVRQLNASFERLCGLLEPGESPNGIDGWEKKNSWLYEVVTDPRILDCVESLLGPDFYQWGSNILLKRPHEGLYLPWHQDACDWPLHPFETLACWLAFDDVDEENGCVKVIPGSHKPGFIRHNNFRPPPKGDAVSLVPFHLGPESVDESRAVPLVLKAGEVSFHHVCIIHGSEANNSPRRRCGFQICYSSTAVKCDTSVRNDNGDWTDFTVFMCRGTDRYGHHAHAEPPRTFGRERRKEYRDLKNVRQ